MNKFEITLVSIPANENHQLPKRLGIETSRAVELARILNATMASHPLDISIALKVVSSYAESPEELAMLAYGLGNMRGQEMGRAEMIPHEGIPMPKDIPDILKSALKRLLHRMENTEFEDPVDEVERLIKKSHEINGKPNEPTEGDKND